jgi:O-antigen/teichoic acid export membrane protein
VLQLMAVVVLARAVTTAMSPMIVVAGRQGTALWLTVASIVLQMGALLVLVPAYGITGAVLGYLAIELLLGVVPVSVFGQHAAGVWLRWSVPLQLIGCAGFAVAVCSLLPTSGTLAGGVLAGAVFLAAAIGTGSLSLRQARSVLLELVASRRRAAV